jgi:nicotinamide phosphoribosyltransferase
MINDKPTEIFKQPKTDDGTKNSLKGLIRVELVNGKYVPIDQVTPDFEQGGCLQTVFENGKLIKEFTLDEIRTNIKHSL